MENWLVTCSTPEAACETGSRPAPPWPTRRGCGFGTATVAGRRWTGSRWSRNWDERCRIQGSSIGERRRKKKKGGCWRIVGRWSRRGEGSRCCSSLCSPWASSWERERVWPRVRVRKGGCAWELRDRGDDNNKSETRMELVRLLEILSAHHFLLSPAGQWAPYNLKKLVIFFFFPGEHRLISQFIVIFFNSFS